MRSPGNGRYSGLELGSDDHATRVCGLGLRARLPARKIDISAALTLARTSDSLLADGNAALNLAGVLHMAGDPARAEKMTRAIEHCQRRGAAAYAARPAPRRSMGLPVVTRQDSLAAPARGHPARGMTT